MQFSAIDDDEFRAEALAKHLGIGRSGFLQSASKRLEHIVQAKPDGMQEKAQAISVARPRIEMTSPAQRLGLFFLNRSKH